MTRLSDNLRFLATKTDGEPGICRVPKSSITAAATSLDELMAALKEAIEFAEQDNMVLTPKGEAMLSRWEDAVAKAEGRL